jgi:hypothetical protein
MWGGQTERRPAPHTASESYAERIRAEERERIAAAAEARQDWSDDPTNDAPWVGRMVATWLRAGAKAE